MLLFTSWSLGHQDPRKYSGAIARYGMRAREAAEHEPVVLWQVAMDGQVVEASVSESVLDGPNRWP
jgi:hypothetical protein